MATQGPHEMLSEVKAFRAGWFGLAGGEYWITRTIFLRALGFIYLIAFWSLFRQLPGLIGKRGILPAASYLEIAKQELGSAGFFHAPTLFWFGASDQTLLLGALSGSLLALVALAGLANSAVFTALWLLYLSFVHVGQIFYGYGWEMLLLETGFLAIFFPFPERPPRFLRAQHYRYRFAPANAQDAAWWQRELLGSFVRPVSLGDPELEAFVRRRGWQ